VTLALGLGLGLAVMSAAASQVGFLMRHRGATAAPDVDVRRPLRSAIGLFRSKWWTIGYGVAALAYVFHVGALSLTALSIVQAVLAGGLVLLAIVAERFFGFELGRRQWIGVILAASGLAFLAVTGEARSGQESTNYSLPAMLAFELALVGVGTALVVSCRTGRVQRHQTGVMLAIAAGLIFAMTHIAVKAISGKVDAGIVQIVVNPFLAMALLGAVAGFFASARSLQIGPAVPVIAVTSIASNASAIPAGILVFGDPLGHGVAHALVRSFAFLLVVAAAALIPAPTRAAEVESESDEPQEREERAPATRRRPVTA
jgi:drug/metabolite transporter (DMT)-like permease